MRLDKWLKASRLIKRRSIAQLACEQGRVLINERPAKAASSVKASDIIHLELGSFAQTVEVLLIPEKAPSIQEASSCYRIIEEIRRK
jgi:ribosomal 50S subunit-recycling heat shock protein